ncbi:hypothetical protein Fmac_008894 [Flemingia macrophylla]|uniref:Uncharacterized protein n=1 Tax=Flemingia macrophylla TaxID=520843 RepID=A0ABD1MYN4_9FABA
MVGLGLNSGVKIHGENKWVSGRVLAPQRQFWSPGASEFQNRGFLAVGIAALILARWWQGKMLRLGLNVFMRVVAMDLSLLYDSDIYVHALIINLWTKDEVIGRSKSLDKVVRRSKSLDKANLWTKQVTERSHWTKQSQWTKNDLWTKHNCLDETISRRYKYELSHSTDHPSVI